MPAPPVHSRRPGRRVSSGPGLSCAVFRGNQDMATASGTSALVTYTYPAAGEYTIHVFAVQADGIGYFAGTKQVTVGDIPAAPSGLSAAAVSGHEVNLTWTDNSNIEVGYVIEQSPDGTNDWGAVAWTDANATYHSLPGPFAPSSSYYFRVMAFTDSAESGYSNTDDVTTVAWPAAPSDLAATVFSETRIDLAWTDLSDEQGYSLERSSDQVHWTPFSIASNQTGYQDTSVSDGTRYYYRLVGWNAAGESPYAVADALTNLKAPSALSVTAVSGHEMNLTWQDNSDAESGHQIEASLDQTEWWVIAEPEADAQSASLEGPFEPSTTYYFRILAYNGVADAAYSSDASAVTGAFPAVPSGLLARTVSDTEIHLIWNDLSNEQGYRLERSSDGTNWTSFNIAMNEVSYPDTSAADGTAYQYRLVGWNGAGDSGYASVRATTELDAPSGLSVAAIAGQGLNQINLTWTDNSAGESRFEIECSLDEVDWWPIADVEADVQGISLESPFAPSTTYYFRVRAASDGGQSPYSAPADDTTSAFPIPPSDLAPTVVSGTRVDLAWADNSSDEDGFVIQRYDGNGWATLDTIDPNSTSFSDTTAQAGTVYFYAVRAASASNGDSPYAGSTALTPLATPSAPSAARNGAHAIEVTWSASAGTPPITYDLYRAEGGSGWSETPYVSGLTGTSYTDRKFDFNRKYVYGVRAVNATGPSLKSSAGAPVITLTGRVTGVEAIWQSGPKVHITWAAPDDGSDPDLNLRYNVYRSANRGATFAKVNSALVTGGSFDDTTAGPAASYVYRVVATNGAKDASNEPIEGLPSAWVSPSNVLNPVSPMLRIDAPAVTTVPGSPGPGQPADPDYYRPDYPSPRYPGPPVFTFTTDVPNLTNRHVAWGDEEEDDFSPTDTIVHQPGYPADLRSYQITAMAQGDSNRTAAMKVASPYFEDFDGEEPDIDEWDPQRLQDESGGGAGTYACYGPFLASDGAALLSLGGAGAAALPSHVALQLGFSMRYYGDIDEENGPAWGDPDDRLEITVDGTTRTVWYDHSDPMIFPHTGNSVVFSFQGYFQEDDSAWGIDMVVVTPLFADASVDSFNDKGHGSGGATAVGGYRLQADRIEENAPGVYIAVDDQDFDEDGIPGFADGFGLLDLDPEDEEHDTNGDNANLAAPVYPLVLSYPMIPGFVPSIKLTYPASYKSVSPSGWVTIMDSPDWPTTPFLLPNSDPIRIWKGERFAHDPRDVIIPNTVYTPADLGGGNGTITLYIQGVREGTGTIQYSLDVDGDGPAGFAAADELRFSAVRVNIAIDSLNQAGFTGQFQPGHPSFELADQREADPTLLGKLVPVSDTDLDADGIIDWADAYNWDGALNTPDDWNGRRSFVPLTITLPEPLDLSVARLQIEYCASDPAAVIRSAPDRAVDDFMYSLPGAGQFRLWTGYEEPGVFAIRTYEPFYVTFLGGAYVPPRYSEESDVSGDGPFDPHFYSPADLERLGFSSAKRSVTLGVEAVRPGEGTISIRVDPDGDGPARFLLADTIRLTGFSVQITQVRSEQLGNVSVNYMPGGTGFEGYELGTNRFIPMKPYMLMGTQADDQYHVGAEFTLTPDIPEIRSLLDFRLLHSMNSDRRLLPVPRGTPTSSTITGNTVSIVGGALRRGLGSGALHTYVADVPWLYVAWGLDFDGDGILSGWGSLPCGEVAGACMEGPIRGVDRYLYTGARDYLAFLVKWLSAANTVLGGRSQLPTAANFLHAFLNDIGLRGATNASGTVEAGEYKLEHNVGAAFNAQGIGPVNLATFPSDMVGLDVILKIVTATAMQELVSNTLKAYETEVRAYFTDNPLVYERSFTFDARDPELYFKNAGRSDRANSDLTYAIGACVTAALDFSVNVHRLPSSGRSGLYSYEVFFDGEITDLYDFELDDDDWWHLAPNAAVVQAGYPTLGKSGHVFKTKFVFGAWSTPPLSYEHCYGFI